MLKLIIILNYVTMLPHHASLKSTANGEDKIFFRRSKKFEGKIVGGVPVSLEHFPYSVQFFNMGAMCAGIILNSWTVLTAAHCFDLNKDIDDMVVQVGSRYINDYNAKQHAVGSFMVHKGYNQTGIFACDIALLFLESPIAFTNKTKKAILVDTNKWMDPREKRFSVSGWGMTKWGGQISDKGLMMTYLRYVPTKTCSQLHQIQMTKDMFCLYGDGQRDTCKGDSGGGVFWKGMLVGITSHGDKCAQKLKPSVYSNVWYFREWIKEEVLRFVNYTCVI